MSLAKDSGVSGALAEARKELNAGGTDTSTLDQLGSILSRIGREQLPEALAHFHNIAGRLPYAGDSDFGALLLESLAADTDNPALIRELLTASLYRAGWCAQSASSGGEGLARSVAVKRIRAKLDSLH